MTNGLTEPLLSGNTRTSKKSCNDIIFSIAFIVCLLGMGVVSIVAFANGRPENLKPSDSNEWTQKAESKLIKEGEFAFQDSVAHLKRDSDILGYTLLFCAVLALVWVQLIKTFTKLFIYLTIFVGIASVLAGAIYFLVMGNSHTRILSYVLFGVAFLCSVAVIFLRKKIALTGALFQEASRGIQNNNSIFLVSLIIFAVMAAFVVSWIAVFIYLFSIPSADVTIPKSPMQFNTKVRNLMYFQVFGFYWTTAFLSGLFQVAIAGAIGKWYFARKNGGSSIVSMPVFGSFFRGLTLSFGSIAFGSLILAIAQFINFLLNQTKRVNFKNRLFVCLISAVQCCLGIVIRFIKFINRYSYIHIAMHGENFCTSARNVTEIVASNLFSATVVNLLGDFVLFVGKMMGTVVCAMFALGITHSLHREISGVTVAVVVIGSYIIFSFFANVISVAVDTVFVCYCEELQENKDKKEKSYAIDSELHDMIQQTNVSATMKSNNDSEWK